MKATTGCLIAFLLACFACTNKKPLFEKTDSQKTGVLFTNQLNETEQENILAFEYFYNGGGVAVGDLNNDGLADLFFTGNQVSNKLFINQTKAGSDLTFDDVTTKAGVAGRAGSWTTGVTLADVNADGWLDVYVCYSGLRADSLRRNQLFINNHNLTFTDRATEYGLADAGYSVQATFFDYDLDGDLDCFLINHNLKNFQRKEASVMRATRDLKAGDKLFRNDGPVQHFTDVSEQAGIKGNPLGFGLGVSVSDLNNDGYPDVYVTNDFVEDDYLYINQRNGTFKDELRDRIEHTSYSAMGVDVADLNNDGLTDIFTLDMLPENNQRQKLLLWPDNWQTYQSQLQNGFWHQNMRNMLQLQQRDGQFAEVGQLAGVSATDWSWGPLLADFDLDGRKDIFISNGLGRDLTNADFVKYAASEEESRTGKPLLEQIKQMTSTPTKNYIFQNVSNGNPGSIQFVNRQHDWGFDDMTRANGSAYADLDNDGDLDLITNNLNEPARIYRNTSRDEKSGHSVTVKLTGPAQNPFGVGATVQLTNGDQTQTTEFYPTRGYLASSHGNLIFGITQPDKPVQVTVRWPGQNGQPGKTQTFQNVKPDAVLAVSFAQATNATPPRPEPVQPLFAETTAPDWTQVIAPTNDFARQIMLPMQYSFSGPRIATGDINGDEQPDAFVCGTPESPGMLLLAQNGSFTEQRLPTAPLRTNTSAVLADFNGDKRLDLYVVNGSYGVRDTTQLQDQLWLNAGNGQFVAAPLPADGQNGSCVTTLDIDRDGDLDIFVGGHVRPGKFPYADESFLLINDGRAGFRRVSLGKIGLVSDAVAMDVDKNGWPDLVLAGEWMPITVLHNQRGQFPATAQQTYPNLTGWWNRLEKADLDGDGDDDLVVGNMGLNTPVRATETEPATLTYGDFDQNGTIDCLMSYFMQGKSYPAHTRDEVGEQIPMLRKTFTTYAAYADATIDQFFSPAVLGQAQTKTINELRTLVLENDNGKFIPHELSEPAQYSPVYGILATDIDRDNRPDLLLMGNNSSFRLRIGKADANYGVVLHNRGNWQFEYVPPTQSGLLVKGDVRDVKRVGSQILVGICQNKLRAFSLAKPTLP